jgi:hypothetical protein
MEDMMFDYTAPRLTKAEGKILIEYVTYSGSAFATCENGDQVFLSARLVDKMDLFDGDQCCALLIENFEDKRDVTPWRAVRVSSIN